MRFFFKLFKFIKLFFLLTYTLLVSLLTLYGYSKGVSERFCFQSRPGVSVPDYGNIVFKNISFFKRTDLSNRQSSIIGIDVNCSNFLRFPEFENSTCTSNYSIFDSKVEGFFKLVSGSYGSGLKFTSDSNSTSIDLIKRGRYHSVKCVGKKKVDIGDEYLNGIDFDIGANLAINVRSDFQEKVNTSNYIDIFDNCEYVVSYEDCTFPVRFQNRFLTSATLLVLLLLLLFILSIPSRKMRVYLCVSINFLFPGVSVFDYVDFCNPLNDKFYIKWKGSRYFCFTNTDEGFGSKFDLNPKVVDTKNYRFQLSRKSRRLTIIKKGEDPSVIFNERVSDLKYSQVQYLIYLVSSDESNWLVADSLDHYLGLTDFCDFLNSPDIFINERFLERTQVISAFDILDFTSSYTGLDKEKCKVILRHNIGFFGALNIPSLVQVLKNRFGWRDKPASVRNCQWKLYTNDICSYLLTLGMDKKKFYQYKNKNKPVTRALVDALISDGEEKWKFKHIFPIEKFDNLRRMMALDKAARTERAIESIEFETKPKDELEKELEEGAEIVVDGYVDSLNSKEVLGALDLLDEGEAKRIRESNTIEELNENLTKAESNLIRALRKGKTIQELNAEKKALEEELLRLSSASKSSVGGKAAFNELFKSLRKDLKKKESEIKDYHANIQDIGVESSRIKSKIQGIKSSVNKFSINPSLKMDFKRALKKDIIEKRTEEINKVEDDKKKLLEEVKKKFTYSARSVPESGERKWAGSLRESSEFLDTAFCICLFKRVKKGALNKSIGNRGVKRSEIIKPIERIAKGGKGKNEVAVRNYYSALLTAGEEEVNDDGNQKDFGSTQYGDDSRMLLIQSDYFKNFKGGKGEMKKELNKRLKEMKSKSKKEGRDFGESGKGGMKQIGCKDVRGALSFKKFALNLDEKNLTSNSVKKMLREMDSIHSAIEFANGRLENENKNKMIEDDEYRALKDVGGAKEWEIVSPKDVLYYKNKCLQVKKIKKTEKDREKGMSGATIDNQLRQLFETSDQTKAEGAAGDLNRIKELMRDILRKDFLVHLSIGSYLK